MVNPKSPAFYDQSNYRPEDSVGYLMRQILTSMAQGIDTQLADSDLTNAQWMPMLKLHLGHASTVAELARACNLDAGAMTRLLDRLEAKGLCTRTRSETDRRVVNIGLTELGRTVAQGIPDVLCQVLNQHLTGFTPEEFLLLKSLLHRVLANTTEASAPHAPSTSIASANPDAASPAAPVSPISPMPPGAPHAI